MLHKRHLVLCLTFWVHFSEARSVPSKVRYHKNELFLFSSFKETLAAEALVGVLLGNRGTSRRRELYASTLTLSRILVLTNKRSTATRTGFIYHLTMYNLQITIWLTTSPVLLSRCLRANWQGYTRPKANTIHSVAGENSLWKK